MILEVIATTLDEAIEIEKAGADRIELISGMLEGGVTPSLALIKKVAAAVSIPVNVMVRPHSKSFVYSENDIKVILEDINYIKSTNANAIVFGALTNSNKIDEETLKKVVDKKGHLKLTFHRAIDEVDDFIEALDVLLKYKVDSVLTSGGKSSAINAVDELNQMVKHANGQIKIIAGAGLKLNNFETFKNECFVKEFHFGSGMRVEEQNLGDISVEAIEKIVKL
jgi:copper homeostasis protein